MIVMMMSWYIERALLISDRPSKRFKGVVKCNLKTLGVNVKILQTITGWKRLIWESFKN